ncbi:Transposase and inactivated derivatives [Acholeplasma oculi]|uniref:Transposase IS200-like protein n=1 Tax=Acholeplasma oculi TaxID=35623 RepID=A0A061A866_9MOLU|nr:IS200/IS605 family transposase [Acholeplasma oculi]CDR30083.1 Transposase IS200-like protein [Acholeplasma oculi]CDR30441.1 Transposase, IS200-like [Acholeplasma oculi]SKC50101.1 putative transposase [Acholeplasma oculi]SKC50749.1 putative transposase [Acholeplasma oculi]SUT88320.1 Transposase and inactivated derivatives [Acholeplasma oculi]
MKNFDNNNHSVFKLNFHLILVINYRREVLDEKISNRLKEIYINIAKTYNISLQTWNHDVDHVHILFTAHPNSEISKFINAYKSASSRLIKKEFPSIKKFLWKEAFWSKSFLLLTTGGAPTEVLKQYIETQGEDCEKNAYSI